MKVASLIFCLAGKCHLRDTLLELIQNLPIGHIANLKVFLDSNALFVTDTTFSFWHQSVAYIIRLADITIYAFPSISAGTLVTMSKWSIGPLRERSTLGLRAIIATESRGADAFPGILVTRRILCTLERIELTVETWWALWGTVIKY